MRQWFKQIILEALKASLKEQPLIISQRAPHADDVYECGTTWKHGNDIYVVRKVTVQWEKLP